MKSNGSDIGLINGLTNVAFVGNANGMQNSEQQISDVNTFIFTIRTTSTKTIVLPLVTNGTYAFWVDWGDGIKDFVRAYSQIYSGETVARTHTYPTALRDYTIKITGVCKGWSYFGLTNERLKLLSIERFGCLELIDDLVNGQYFANCNNLQLKNVKDTLSTKYLTSMVSMFGTSTVSNININLINNWDVSRITNMIAFFQNCTSFNDVISNWNVSNVINMSAMFSGATNFNQDISNWNVSNITNMEQLFYFANSFNQPIGSWDVSNVTNMFRIFENATSFNQDISKWNVSKVTTFQNMFSGVSNFNNGNNSDTNPITGLQGINGWNINTLSNVNMSNMFNSAIAFNQPIGLWNTSRVTNMSNMFNSAAVFDQDIGAWNIGAVTGITGFMSTKTPATFSAANLDAIYNGWSSRPSNSNLSITFGTAKYTSASSAGRAILVGRGWTIVDGGI